MRLRLEQDAQAEEISILIRYAEKTQILGRLVRAVKSCGEKIEAQDENKTVILSITDIYYFESVDKKTFAYCKEKVYRVNERLYQLKDSLARYGFVQLNKACLLNINVLDGVKSLVNSKMEASLINGERVSISRKYIPELKAALKER